jgi:hypothetical protein
MGKKLVVSMAMEGKLQADGLQIMDEDDDMLTAMARELVTRQGVGEQAAEVWRALTKIQPASSCTPVIDECRPEGPKEEEEPRLWIPSDGPAEQLSLF